MNGGHVVLKVKQIGDYKLDEPFISRFSLAPRPRPCFFCNDIIDFNEIYFKFGKDSYCIGCVKYE